MDTLLALIGGGITSMLQSITPSSWRHRPPAESANNLQEGSLLHARLAQAELRNKELEARIAALESRLQEVQTRR